MLNLAASLIVLLVMQRRKASGWRIAFTLLGLNVLIIVGQLALRVIL